MDVLLSRRGWLPLVLVLLSTTTLACDPSGRAGAPGGTAASLEGISPPAQGTRGMVSSAHPLATEIGLETLEAEKASLISNKSISLTARSAFLRSLGMP